MTRHSKNNTSLGYFTKAEKDKLKKDYGTIEARLDKRSIKNFCDCGICLKTAINPLCCNEGHIFCRECILKNILAQRKSHKNLKMAYKNHKASLKNKQNIEIEKAKTEALKTFEKTNNTLNFADSNSQLEVETKSLENEYDSSVWGLRVKTPENKIRQIKKPNKLKIICPRKQKTSENTKMGTLDHQISFKKLAKISFLLKNGEIWCKICDRKINNNCQTVALVDCGHVFCQKCVEKALKNSKICIECEEKFKKYQKLEKGGSGFAAHGNNIEAKKYSQPFIS
ncbi:hypothetical protein MHBO_001068 [Bonamia ostreae]|uniref:RING-type domain-containing protein n=1 Tax=Bonamia ostreae TaxID=126728 RepID=A0ABV2AHP2_9EUKA